MVVSEQFWCNNPVCFRDDGDEGHFSEQFHMLYIHVILRCGVPVVCNYSCTLKYLIRGYLMYGPPNPSHSTW